MNSPFWLLILKAIKILVEEEISFCEEVCKPIIGLEGDKK